MPDGYDVISLYSDFDELVIPTANAEYNGAFNVQIRSIGHFSLLTSPRVFELIIENLEAPL